VPQPRPLTPLVEENDIQTALGSYQRVFTGERTAPFPSAMDERAVVFFDSHGPDPEDVSALLEAMRILDEDSFYVTGQRLPERDKFWLVTPELLPQYLRGRNAADDDSLHLFLFESALYSTRGTWGIWTDEYPFAFAGSSSAAFMQTLIASSPPAPTDISRDELVEIPASDAPAEFVRFWALLAGNQPQSISTGLMSTLEHMYPPDQVRRFLREGGWHEDHVEA